jgi:D-galacturonate reductase
MKPHVLMVGAGMIAHDQILPSLYQLQRLGVTDDLTIVAQSASSIQKLRENEGINRAFPGHTFIGYPESGSDPNAYRDLLATVPPNNIVVAAVPDQLHYDVVMAALRADQHVLCVKPLVLTARESLEIEREAFERGLVVGIEYHKRFDDRSFMARQRYRAGMFGEFKLGTARLMEKWYYRESNFQNWCTVENSDAFSYIGCHYVDLVHFVTGLLPVSVSVYGIKDKYPNGNEGYLWSDARVIWENGACLNVQNSLSFPDEGPGTNTQGMTLYTSANGRGGLLSHSDQYRGLEYCYIDRPKSAGATMYAEPSPDYFQYVDVGGPGLQPVGYGYRSVEYIIRCCIRAIEAGDIRARQAILRELDEKGVLATPRNSRYNELVMEAGRESILNGGREVRITHA